MFDGDAEEKKSVVRSLYESGVVRGDAVISTQVLQEFYVTVTRKLGSPLADELGESLFADVRRHAHGRPQKDDITILTFGRNPA